MPKKRAIELTPEERARAAAASEELARAEAKVRDFGRISRSHRDAPDLLRKRADLRHDVELAVRKMNRIADELGCSRPFKYKTIVQLSNARAKDLSLADELARARDRRERREGEGEAFTSASGPGWRVERLVNEEDARDRIAVSFEGKPRKEVCQALRANGWKWSPTRKAWVRFADPLSRDRPWVVDGLVRDRSVEGVPLGELEEVR